MKELTKEFGHVQVSTKRKEKTERKTPVSGMNDMV
jgi:hypothetical protein